MTRTPRTPAEMITDQREMALDRFASEKNAALSALRRLQEELVDLERQISECAGDHSWRNTPSATGIQHRTRGLVENLTDMGIAMAKVNGLDIALAALDR